MLHDTLCLVLVSFLSPWHRPEITSKEKSLCWLAVLDLPVHDWLAHDFCMLGGRIKWQVCGKANCSLRSRKQRKEKQLVSYDDLWGYSSSDLKTTHTTLSLQGPTTSCWHRSTDQTFSTWAVGDIQVSLQCTSGCAILDTSQTCHSLGRWPPLCCGHTQAFSSADKLCLMHVCVEWLPKTDWALVL